MTVTSYNDDRNRIANLVKNALKHGLTQPDLILIYVKQQDIENVTLSDIISILKAIN